MADIESEIRRLAVTIHELMKRATSGWVTWKQAARQHTGSEDAADMLASMAMLPDYQHFFFSPGNGRTVKLTEEGLDFIRKSPSEQATIPSLIATAVVNYARGLRPIVLDVIEASVVAKVRNKVVHAVEVEISDEVLPNETPVSVRCLNGRPVAGKLVGQEPDGGIIYVACDTDITSAERPHKLIIDRAFLLTQLAEQIRSLSELPDRLNSIFTEVPKRIIADPNSLVVAEQLAELAAPWTRFLWGPPGAGKTFGLGRRIK